MRSLLLAWGPLAMLHLAAGGTQLFARHKESIRFGTVFKTGVVNVSLFFLVLLWTTWQTGTLTASVLDLVLVASVLAYGTYACFKFGYVYTGNSFRWFNGLVSQEVFTEDIRDIAFRSNSKRVVKVRFDLATRSVSLRNDLPEIGVLVGRMASEHNITALQERLPWWSV